MFYSFSIGHVVPVINNTAHNSLAVLFGHKEELNHEFNECGFYVTKLSINDNFDPSNPKKVFVSLKGENNYGVTVYALENIPNYRNNTAISDELIATAFLCSNIDVIPNGIIIEYDNKNHTFVRMYDDDNGVASLYIDSERIDSMNKIKFIQHMLFYGIELLDYPLSQIPLSFFNEVKDYTFKGINYYLRDWTTVNYQLSFHRDDNGNYNPRMTRWYPGGISGWVCDSCYGVIIDTKFNCFKLHNYLFRCDNDEVEKVLYMNNKDLQEWKNYVLARI